MKLRVFFFMIGLVFIGAGLLAPIDDRKGTRYELVGAPIGKRTMSEGPTVKVYWSTKELSLFQKYASVIIGGLVVYFSIRKLPSDYFPRALTWKEVTKRRKKRRR